ncbi:unnamed protein product [Cuscuta epithymum]|uniref:Uncharacterized protein n=1 Tax=Cuscuta epithymum TaxID=186058 RepID=A0AAV0CDZ7_9ASTE|nr:unnamed protein product [Cuscuta epithymum]
MNAASSTQPDFVPDISGGSDSDTNSDEASQYYQPIASDVSDDEESPDRSPDLVNEDGDQFFSDSNRLPNGYACFVENGVSSLNLSDEDGECEEGLEEERIRASSDSSLRRPFRDDESRRSVSLSLTPENAMRVMEAMRGISFSGVAPDWAAQVPESQWIQRLRTIRQASTVTNSPIQD